MRLAGCLFWFLAMVAGQPIARASPSEPPSIVVMRDGTSFMGRLTVDGSGRLRVTYGDGRFAAIAVGEVDRIFFHAPTEPGEGGTPAPATSRPAVEMISESGVFLRQSATDALNGIVGYSARGEPKAGLTDARSAIVPAEDIGPFHGVVTWDLGPSPEAASRQLDAVSIWINARAGDGGDYAGSLAVSVGGREFWAIPDSEQAVAFTKEGPFNHVVYRFGAGRVTDFRHLRLILHTPLSGNDTRLVEVDAFISKGVPDPLKMSGIVTRGGSHIVGTIESGDADSIRFKGIGGSARDIPLAKLERINWYCLPPPAYAGIPKGACGAVLRNGDFCEGEFRGVQGDRVVVSSVVLGLRKFSVEREIGAIVLPARADKPTSAYWLMTMDGSVYSASSARLDANGIEIDEPSLGALRFDRNQLVELARINVPAESTGIKPANQ